jgi:hypothetical protein
MVMMLIVLADLAKSFGQSAIFVLLFLVGGIGSLMLGFGKYQYVGPAAGGGQLPARATAV